MDDLWLSGLAHVGERSVVDGFIECIDRCAGSNVLDVSLTKKAQLRSLARPLFSSGAWGTVEVPRPQGAPPV